VGREQQQQGNEGEKRASQHILPVLEEEGVWKRERERVNQEEEREQTRGTKTKLNSYLPKAVAGRFLFEGTAKLRTFKKMKGQRVVLAVEKQWKEVKKKERGGLVSKSKRDQRPLRRGRPSTTLPLFQAHS